VGVGEKEECGWEMMRVYTMVDKYEIEERRGRGSLVEGLQNGEELTSIMGNEMGRKHLQCSGGDLDFLFIGSREPYAVIARPQCSGLHPIVVQL
jgi:hypothetical protein